MSDHVTFVLPGLERSGGYRTLCEWANRCTRDGKRVAVVSPADGPGRDYLLPDVEVRTQHTLRRLNTAAALRLGRPLLGDRADLSVFPHAIRHLMPAGSQVILGFVPWQPSLAVPDVVRYCQHWEPVWFREGSWARRRAEEAMYLPGRTIVNSSWLKARLPGRESALVFPGVDTAVFCPDGPMTVDSLPPRIPGWRRVVALGRLDVPWKGGAELLAALDGQAQIELCLYGTSQLSDDSVSWGRLRKVGPLAQTELAALIRSADLVVTPSWFESFPLPPLEAMACGTAVVTTREGTEDYAVDGLNALVVPGRDVPALHDAVARMLGDAGLRDRLARRGRDDAQRFTWDVGYEQFRRAMAW